MAIVSLQVHVDEEINRMVAAIKKARKVRREDVIADAVREAYNKYVLITEHEHKVSGEIDNSSKNKRKVL